MPALPDIAFQTMEPWIRRPEVRPEQQRSFGRIGGGREEAVSAESGNYVYPTISSDGTRGARDDRSTTRAGSQVAVSKRGWTAWPRI